jgi:hypothetical protein
MLMGRKSSDEGYWEWNVRPYFSKHAAQDAADYLNHVLEDSDFVKVMKRIKDEKLDDNCDYLPDSYYVETYDVV